MTTESLDDTDRDRRIGEAVAAYFNALDAGLAPDREAFLRQHPDLAEDLAACFSQYDRFQNFLAPLRSSVAKDPSEPSTQADAGATAEYRAPGADPLAATRSGTGTAPPEAPSPGDDLPETDEGGDDGNGAADPDLPRGTRWIS
jgi:hypothetical protein